MTSGRPWVTFAGVCSSLAGVLAAVLGIVLVGVVGPDGTVRTGREPLTTTTRALVLSIDDVDGMREIGWVTGTPRLHVSVTGASTEMFVGVAPAGRVEQYLAGAAIDRVDDLEIDPFRLRKETRAGNVAPGRPADQDIWVARSAGRSPSLDWTFADGSYRVVLMRADAALGVASAGRLGFELPHAFPIGVGVIVIGALLGGLGVVLVVRKPRHPQVGEVR